MGLFRDGEQKNADTMVLWKNSSQPRKVAAPMPKIKYDPTLIVWKTPKRKYIIGDLNED